MLRKAKTRMYKIEAAKKTVQQIPASWLHQEKDLKDWSEMVPPA